MNLPSPTLDLRFDRGMIPQDLEFTRPSTATRINEERMIEMVPAHQPRIDYDPNTGACRGLLIEPERTNHFDTSQDASTWGATGSYSGQAEVSNDVPRLHPNATVSKITKTEGGDVRTANAGFQGQWPRDVKLTISFWCRVPNPDDFGRIELRIRYFHESYNNDKVELTAPTQANEWTRIHGTWTTPPEEDPAGENQIYFYFDWWTNPGNVMYLTCPQVEIGPYPTSYIPTTTSSPETRAVDLVHVPDVFDGGHIPDGCVIVSDLDRHSHRRSQNVHTWTLIDGGIATHQRHWASGPIGVDTRWASWNGAPQWPCTEGHTEGRQVLATQIARDGLRQFKDGDQVADIRPGGTGNCREYQWRPENLPTGPVDLEFGQWTNKREVAARYHRLQLYDRPLSNDTLRKLTMTR